MRKFSTILIIIGIILILIPTIGHLYTKNVQDKAYEEYLESIKNNDNNTATNNENSENIIENTENEDNSSSSTTENNTDDTNLSEDSNNNISNNNDVASIPIDAGTHEEIEEEIKKEEKPKPKLDVIGKVIIKKIDVDMLFIDGISEIDLIYGAGHMNKTAYPGETGNCAIPAHRGFSFGTYFYRLDELEDGDIIEIEYLGNIFKYSVDNKFIIKPTDTYILKQPKDKKIVTLITCDPPVTGTHRLIVTGTLIEKENDDENTQ